jgi:hypothetical protein
MRKIYNTIIIICAVFFIFFITNCNSDEIDDDSEQQSHLKEYKADFIAHFDESISVDIQQDLSFDIYGGEIINDGVRGGALRLEKGEYLAIDAASVLGQQEGTVMFWVRPHWDYNVNTSHTFISYKWADMRNGYFVLSDGWWENGGGAPFTYLIYNNMDYIKTHQVVNYKKGQWICIAYTWKYGKNPFVKLYINNSIGRKLKNVPFKKHSPKGKLYLGSDKGTPLSNNRWGDCDIDEFTVFDKALSDDEYSAIYNMLKPQINIQESEKREKKSGSKLFQIRAIFDEGSGWTTSDGAMEIIQRIKKAGFNVYIPCVWHGRGTRYYSDIAPMEENLNLSEDPLSYLISIAHQNNIEVHPWFTVALRQRDFLQKFYEPGTPKKAFDLHNKEFRKFISSLIMEVVHKYDVDGINLDYIRTMGICKSNFCIQNYFQRYGRNLLKDILDKSKLGCLEPHLQKWQDEAVESIVRDVSEKGKSIDPELIISVDGQPYPGTKKYNHEGRQEIAWANKNYIDLIYFMDYNLPPDFERMRMAKEMLNDKNKLVPLLGNYKYTNQGKVVAHEFNSLKAIVQQAQSDFPHGIGIYLYKLLNKNQITMLKNGPFCKSAYIKP